MKENEKLAELLELMKAHPELPVIPMVWEEVVAEQASCYWRGSWEYAKVTRYVVGEKEIHFYDEDDMSDCLYDTYHGDPDLLSDEERLTVYRSLPWVDAIVVYIGMPED